MCEKRVPNMSEKGVPARIECLPVEIIQTIFLHCVEFNLPRASIHIARALSDPVIYTWLIRLAFTIDNHESRGILTPEYLPPPLDFLGLSKQERTGLQSAILESRWCTLPLMRKCQLEYIKHVIAIQCTRLEFSSEDKNKLSNLEQRFEESVSIMDTQGAPSEDLVEDLRIFAMCESTYGSPGTYDDCVLSIWFNSGLVVLGRPVDGLFFPVSEEEYRFPACVSTTPRMPDKLLSPPWTPEKLSFLTLLAEEAYIDEDENFECSRRILRQVIRDRDLGTFQRLFGLCIRLRCYNYSKDWPLLPCHFRAALKYADERDDPFIKLLVEKRWCDVPEDIQLKDKLLRRYNAAGAEYKWIRKH